MEKKKELETVVTADGREMLKAEPVNFAGFTEYWQIDRCQKGVMYMLNKLFMQEGALDMTDKHKEGIWSVLNWLEQADGYMKSYLVRRIEQLEAANSLKHCGDIDTEDTEKGGDE